MQCATAPAGEKNWCCDHSLELPSIATGLSVVCVTVGTHIHPLPRKPRTPVNRNDWKSRISDYPDRIFMSPPTWDWARTHIRRAPRVSLRSRRRAHSVSPPQGRNRAAIPISSDEQIPQPQERFTESYGEHFVSALKCDTHTMSSEDHIRITCVRVVLCPIE